MELISNFLSIYEIIYLFNLFIYVGVETHVS